MPQRVPCKICKQLFNPTYLTIHKRLHTGEKPYRCVICQARFMFHSGILHHMKKFHKDNSSGDRKQLEYDYIKRDNKAKRSVLGVKCIVCLKLFPNKKALRSHSRVHGDEEVSMQYQCKDCFKRFDCSESYLEHVCGETDHGYDDSSPEKYDISEMTVKCANCSKTFPNDNELAAHMKVHKSENLLLRCSLCMKFFRSKAQLNAHIEDDHSDDSVFSCKTCGKQFTKKFKLDLHMRMHTSAPTPSTAAVLTCKTCDITFDTAEKLVRHYATHAKREKCSICSKMLPDKASLNAHMKTHVQQNQTSKCKICGASFKRRQHLELHHRIHKNADRRPYRCSKCRAGFVKEFTCQLHMNSIHKIGFEKSVNMQLRQGVHECVKCLKVLESHEELVEHLKVNHYDENKTSQMDDSINVDDSEKTGSLSDKDPQKVLTLGKRQRPSSPSPRILNTDKSREPPTTSENLSKNSAKIGKTDRENTNSAIKTYQDSIYSHLRSLNDNLLTTHYVYLDLTTTLVTDPMTKKLVYKCQVCDTTFTLKENFKRHIRNKAYSHDYYLKKKIDGNYVERRKRAKIYNPGTENNLSTRQVNKAVDMQETNTDKERQEMAIKMKRYKYICDVCGLSYTRKLNMQQHRNKHTDEAFKRAGVERDSLPKNEIENDKIDQMATDLLYNEKNYDVYMDRDEVPVYEEMIKTSNKGTEQIQNIDEIYDRTNENDTEKQKEEMIGGDEEMNTDITPSHNESNESLFTVPINQGQTEQSNSGTNEALETKPELNDSAPCENVKPKPCPGCTLPSLEGQKTVECQLCNTMFCVMCSGIPQLVYELSFENEVNPPVVWFCRICRPLFPKMTVLLRQLGQFEESINDKVSDIEKRIQKIKENVTSLRKSSSQ